MYSKSPLCRGAGGSPPFPPFTIRNDDEEEPVLGNRTIYLKPEDETLWVQAEARARGANVSVSRLIMDGLRLKLAETATGADEAPAVAHRIVVEVDEPEGVRLKGFHGQWLHEPTEDALGDLAGAGLTTDSRVVFYMRKGTEGARRLVLFETWEHAKGAVSKGRPLVDVPSQWLLWETDRLLKLRQVEWVDK